MKWGQSNEHYANAGHKDQQSGQRAAWCLKQLSPDFLDPAHEWRRIFAETWGTFLLVLVAAGGGVVAAKSGGTVTLGMAVVAPGLMVMAIIYFMGTVSGAHLNPAVTLAFAVRRNFPWRRVPGYVLAQLFGAVTAANSCMRCSARRARWARPCRADGVGNGTALAIEVVLTAGLVNTILGTASGARNIGTNGAIAVGGYIILAGLWAASFSGASMNPARSLRARPGARRPEHDVDLYRRAGCWAR